jgi:hypothetical protein
MRPALLALLLLTPVAATAQTWPDYAGEATRAWQQMERDQERDYQQERRDLDRSWRETQRNLFTPPPPLPSRMLPCDYCGPYPQQPQRTWP